LRSSLTGLQMVDLSRLLLGSRAVCSTGRNRLRLSGPRWESLGSGGEIQTKRTNARGVGGTCRMMEAGIDGGVAMTIDEVRCPYCGEVVDRVILPSWSPTVARVGRSMSSASSAS